MADPILDEDGIIMLLKAPVGYETTNLLQAGAVQALLDMYDRKVTREEFCEHASRCIGLYNEAGKLWMLGNIFEVYLDGSLDRSKFDTAKASLVELVQRQCETLIDMVQRLKQCPTSQDKVH